METPDRSVRPALPASWPATSPSPSVSPSVLDLPAHGAAWDDLADGEVGPSKAFTVRTMLRTIRRHWWKILLVWSVGSIGLMALAYYRIKPSYEATAWLKVEPTSGVALNPSSINRIGDLGQFMETQLRLITSPDVLGTALQDPMMVPRIKMAEDPELALRQAITAAIPPKTNLILIATSSSQPHEVAPIVNAVVEAYLKASSTWLDTETKKQIDNLKKLKAKLESDIQGDKDKLLQLAARGAAADPRDSAQTAVDEFRTYKARHSQIQLDLIETEAMLGVLREVQAAVLAEEGPSPGPMTDEQIDRAMRQAYLSDPEAMQLHMALREAEDRLEGAQRLAPNRPSDPAVRRYIKERNDLKQENQQLWERKKLFLRDQIAALPTSEETDPRALELKATEIRLAKLKEEETSVQEKLDSIQIKQQNEGNDALLAQFAQRSLEEHSDLYRRVSAMVEQMDLEAHGPARITLVDKARAPTVPSSNHQRRVMAIAPIGVLMAVLGLFVLFESRTGRVADPDDLTRRLRLGVLGVVPPLPSLRVPKGAKALRDQRRRVEEFVQSLDHLRVTLCSGRSAHRCVMITSACGGEGKTTLAAQLAGRCANAGMTTLLVDADLRRPSLGELLEVPEGPGLAEVLLGEATPEEAMVVVGNAGGFHLLPAGAPGHDPSRLLQGERLGQLVARLREAFDIVLIDAPPVLAVPDALLLGRWADGAVVAVRHDSSRFPMVERAQKRLAAVGVSVLGAVVNGMRPPESSYGAYGYYLSEGEGRRSLARADEA